MSRLLQQAAVLTALLISGIDSKAMLRSAPQAHLAGFSQALVARRAHPQPTFERALAEPRPTAARTVAFPVAPPAVTLVDRASFVSLRDDVANILFGGVLPGSSGSPSLSSSPNSYPLGAPSDDDASASASASAFDPLSTSEQSVLWSACLIVLLSSALGFAASRIFGRRMRELAARFDAIASDGYPCAVIPEQGPRALRRLARNLNRMLVQRCNAIAEQSTTLAALGEHLESHALRLRRATLLVKEWQQRVALVEDVDLFSHIARQFVELNRCAPAGDSDMPVEAFLRDRFVMTSSLDAGLFVCRFGAGADFRLPRTVLERVMSNLVDNALEYGSPPIEISTYREHDEWVLTIRDHGAGIEPSQLSDATSTFVRLGRDADDARHWGLGLALVKRLVANARGRLVLDNHADGGLFVRIAFPVPRNAADAQSSPRAARARDVARVDSRALQS